MTSTPSPSSASSDPEIAALRAEIEALVEEGAEVEATRARPAVAQLLDLLAAGRVRSAERAPSGWAAVPWVKRGILLAFKVGRTESFAPFAAAENTAFDGSTFTWSDRDTLPLRPADAAGSARLVPGGTSVRHGAHLADGVVVMPPAYVNVGAFVDEGSMVDSHALVGSCAQVGKRVHLSAGAQLGGVLEPVGLRPVIIDDEVMVGANCGVFEGTLVSRRAVLASGVQLTASTVVYDLVKGTTLRATANEPLTIPEGAVVVPGSRPASGDFAREHGLHLYAPMIVKYRDDKTNAATALEDALR
ncbi:2,3,4,5-tetrahydropyridine-2,6-dicarboxylate N-succinyltransferase [Gaopeijia maritima]|uniref:2,3,4,5-tetrahydropyridine-2,6-dicarboxylate N-succinyltransferase n=1 Tax=Gaopeijia maritima TaxID=3119007 RepID=A0ABU9E8B8_9BACT